MKTISNVCEVTVEVDKKELIEGKWLNFKLLSQKLCDMEKSQNMDYKQLRSKLYNSINSGKYNTAEKYGLSCIDVDNPMKATASLKVNFKKV